jgi:hypothetical protein
MIVLSGGGDAKEIVEQLFLSIINSNNIVYLDL